MKKKLLINWLYKHPVGHVAEALKLAKGYSLANENLEIYLIINADSPAELADGCPWIKQTYTISVKELVEKGIDSEYLKKIPKEWDYIITDKRSESGPERQDLTEFFKAHKILSEELIARIAKGNERENVLPCVRNPKTNLEVPRHAREFALKFSHVGPSICIMLGGSKGLRQSPTIEKWLRICQALEVAIPGIKFYFTGITRSDEHRTVTKDFTLEDINYLISQLNNAEAAYNIGLWNQVALVEKCDIFLSPHTGFAFLACLVDTPWLEIATCRWPMYFFNDVPFYSVLPKCNSYPSLDDRDKECDRLLRERKRVACVADNLIEKKISEIVEGAKLLLDKQFTYERSMELHIEKIKKDYDLSRFHFLAEEEKRSKGVLK